jgi:mycoredoxin-dependent peroxiredoxin
VTVAGSPLPVGEPAPGFTLRDQHGVDTSLSGLRGRDVLLVFYPFAFSGVCSGELRALQDAWPALAAPDRALLAVSCDPVYALRAYADRDGIDFPLLSDFWPHGAVAAAYGVLDPAIGAPHRSSFLVDQEGVVRWSLNVPRPASRAISDYVEALEKARKAKYLGD